MRDDPPPHLHRIVHLRQHARARGSTESSRHLSGTDTGNGQERSSRGNHPTSSRSDASPTEIDFADDEPSLVVLAPDAAIGAITAHLEANANARRDESTSIPARHSTQTACMTVADLADRLACTHPAFEDSTRISASTTAGLLRDALNAMDASTRAELDASGEMKTRVRSLCHQVRSLREHDVSPATLYAVSPGAGMTAELRALAIAYEAYDRYLLESPQHDLADLFGWATAQLRTGRAAWIEEATVAVYDHIHVSGAAASFLRALRDFAGRFEQIGADANGPPASVSARIAALDRLPDLDAMLNAPAESSSDTASESSPETHPFFYDMLSRYVAPDPSADFSWVVAPGGLQQALDDFRRMGWNDADMEVAVRGWPEDTDLERETTSPNLATVPFEAAGFRMRDLLVIDATHGTHLAMGREANPTRILLNASMRRKIEALTGAVLPSQASDPSSEIWQMAQMLWRHTGEVVLVTSETSGPVADLLQNHLNPHVLRAEDRSPDA